MCDENTERDNEHFELNGGPLNRRDFARLSAAGAFALAYPHLVGAKEEAPLLESDVAVPMASGVSDSYFVRPAEGNHPAVLMWPDIRGLRPAFRAMGKRLALEGYAVLVVNPFYRDAKAPVVATGEQFSNPKVRERLIPMYQTISQESLAMSDARDYLAFLDAQNGVDTSRKAGTAGYCMGGPLIMRTASALPERIGAAASFHGGGLLTDAPDSPHLLIPRSPARVLHAIAENDHERTPQVRDLLITAYAESGIRAEIEVYEDTLHGWCPPDSQVYDEKQAERAWSRMLALFREAL